MDNVRDRAVRNVDQRHGYTVEHAPCAAAHRAEYDEEEERLLYASDNHLLTGRQLAHELRHAPGVSTPVDHAQRRTQVSR